LTLKNFRRTLVALEKNDQNTYLTKTILRSYGYGLPRKPRIFQPCQVTDRARPSGRGLEREIDELVYALYGLTKEEKDIVKAAAK
jgi:hypothetical protein